MAALGNGLTLLALNARLTIARPKCLKQILEGNSQVRQNQHQEVEVPTATQDAS